MRIISGKYRGKQLHPPRQFSARPTTDFAKESLFNILNNYLNFEDIIVLDLFSGTGSISLEFCSRGCNAVDAVEKDPVHAGFIRKTAVELGFTGLRVIQSDVSVFLKHHKASYDLIFADPPYDMDGIQDLPSRILNQNFLKDGGWLILEHSSQYKFSSADGCFDERRYGKVHFSFFKLGA